jgi:uncharacterized protein (DUF608 family)
VKLSRRQLLGALPAVVSAAAAGVALAACGQMNEQGADGLLPEGGPLWEIPDAAWKRALGSYPPGATGSLPAYGSLLPPITRTKRGIPVGGIGTGSFMFNLCGSFGPWHMDIGGDDSVGSRWGSMLKSGFEQRFLSGAAFHVRLSTPSSTTVDTLATEDTLASWNPIQPGQGVYSALFPKAWFEYDLLLPVALKQVTPFVARDEYRSSLPAGIFELAVDNPTGENVEVACMFSFPNAIYRLPTTQYTYTRTGLRSQAVRGSGTAGVRLQAQDPANVPETQRTEWVIAAKGPSGSTLSTTEDWAADGDGSDLYSVFSDLGELPNRAIDPRRRALGGAVAVSFSLAPYERKAATFVLAWDFPVVQFRNPVDGTRWWKRYKQWYPGHYRAWDIASDVLAGSSRIEQGIDAWWRKVSDNDKYPLWLRCAALNELYYDVFGGVFWENGCITKPKRFGARPGQHLYFTLETDEYRDCESLDVRHYEARHLLQLFPTIEQDLLLGWADMVNAEPTHLTPHDAGSPVEDPWFVVDQYAATRPGEPPLGVDWLDTPAKFVQEAHACWAYTGDNAFGRAIYPAAERAMNHLLSRDLDGDGIPDADGFCTSYDNIPMSGATTYVAALTIGACEAMADFAKAFDSQKAVQRWQEAASLARSSAETSLWSEEAGFYVLGSGGPYGQTLMADALCGQRYPAAHKLADVLDRRRMAEHLSQVYENNVLVFFSGRFGAVNIVAPSGAPLHSFQARAVWPGGSYFTAAVMYEVGRSTGRHELLANALDTAHGVYRTTYEDDASAFWFDTPAEWLPASPLRYRAAQYKRCRAAWELMVTIEDPFPPGWSPS